MSSLHGEFWIPGVDRGGCHRFLAKVTAFLYDIKKISKVKAFYVLFYLVVDQDSPS